MTRCSNCPAPWRPLSSLGLLFNQYRLCPYENIWSCGSVVARQLCQLTAFMACYCPLWISPPGEPVTTGMGIHARHLLDGFTFAPLWAHSWYGTKLHGCRYARHCELPLHVDDCWNAFGRVPFPVFAAFLFKSITRSVFEYIKGGNYLDIAFCKWCCLKHEPETN